MTIRKLQTALYKPSADALLLARAFNFQGWTLTEYLIRYDEAYREYLTVECGYIVQGIHTLDHPMIDAMSILSSVPTTNKQTYKINTMTSQVKITFNTKDIAKVDQLLFDSETTIWSIMYSNRVYSLSIIIAEDQEFTFISELDRLTFDEIITEKVQYFPYCIL